MKPGELNMVLPPGSIIGPRLSLHMSALRHTSQPLTPMNDAFFLSNHEIVIKKIFLFSLNFFCLLNCFLHFGVTERVHSRVKAGFNPGWVTSSLHGPIWVFVGLEPCSKVSWQCSDTFPYYPKCLPQLVCTGAWTQNPLFLPQRLSYHQIYQAKCREY